MNDSQKLQILWDKQEITEVVHRFARALDRVDGELMKDCYWEDATEEHQDPIFPDKFFWNGNGHEFVPIAMKGFHGLKDTQHRIANMLIELDGDHATAECYVWAYHLHEEDGKDMEGTLGGRHLFRFERREGEWKILHRKTVFDFNQSQDATAFWGEAYEDRYKGKRIDYSDASYDYIERGKAERTSS
jgi:hypothetical protein